MRERPNPWTYYIWYRVALDAPVTRKLYTFINKQLPPGNTHTHTKVSFFLPPDCALSLALRRPCWGRRITSFLEWRKPTRINQISNTPCGFFSNLAFAGMRNQSKQSSHSPWPSPTSYIPSGQAAPSSAPLVQPDNFRQVTLPFPLLSQSPAFSLAFQTTQKLAPTLPVVSFSSLEYTKSFHGTLPPWHDTL